LHRTPKEDQNLDAFFRETGIGKFVPRALFIDLEPDHIDSIRAGQFGNLLFPE
jgi:tubulin alpha